MKKRNELLFFLLFIGFLFFYLAKGNIFGYVYYPFDSFSYAKSYGFNDIAGIYNNYSGWFDFAIFLIIFLSLSKTVFGERFEESKGVYIGVGLFLAFALILWESRTGYNMFSLFGGFAVAIIFFLIIFILFSWLRKAGVGLMMSLSIFYAVGWWIFRNYFDRIGFLSNLIYTSGFDFIFGLLNFLWPISIIIAIASILYKIFRRGG